jgi:hypothetical protein
MYRLTILAFLSGALLAAQSDRSDSAAGRMIQFAFYAPPQKGSPVHIVGFEHTESEIQFVLSNTSDKSVVGVLIGRIESAPPGCATETRKNNLNSSGGRFQLLIPPHGNAELWEGQGQAHYPKTAVYGARELGAAYLQAQFGVTGVFFEDGTTWPREH